MRLAAKGYDLTVYCETGDGPRPDTFRGINLVYLPAPNLGPLTTVLFDLRCLWHARKGYEVVYMLGYGASIFCFIPRLWGSKIWINVDGIEWARAKWNRVAKAYFKIMEAVAVHIAHRVIADAAGIEAFLRARHKSMAPCTVIPYGAHLVEVAADRQQLAAWGIQVHQYYLVVCRLEPENHVLEILKGYSRSDTPYPLLVVGDHAANTDYVEQLKKVKDDRIRFVGTVYDQHALRHLRYFSRAYFHGHSVGGTNPSLLEALGCGNIVLAHDNLFNREVAASAGLYFKEIDDIRKLIKQIDDTSEQERAERSVKAKQRILDAYTWERITEQYLDLLAKRSERVYPV